MLKTIQIKSVKRDQMIDITSKVAAVLQESGLQEGICTIYVPHTTAGVTINENADPDVVRDMLKSLDRVVPHEDGYHHFEGNSAAHIKASMMGFSQQVIVHKQHLLLGTWQGLYFCEFDGPRNRKVHIQIQ